MESARDFMNDLHIGVAEHLAYHNSKEKKKPELSKDAISPEQATEQLQGYAKKNGLVYKETPLLTPLELQQSEEHPVGGAQIGKNSNVASRIEQSKSDDLYSALLASSFERGEQYTVWKIEDVAAHEPKSLEEPGVKEKATLAWRTFKARALAEKRAQELTDLVTKSDKPMAEVLADQTVTGAKEGSLFVPVQPTGNFSWLQRSIVPGQFGDTNSAPNLGAITGVKGAGNSFMTKVFNEMQPGQTAVVPNIDRSVIYVMHIDQRTPATEAEVEVMRKQFLESQGDLTRFAFRQSMAHDGNYIERMYTKHGIRASKAIEGTDE